MTNASIAVNEGRARCGNAIRARQVRPEPCREYGTFFKCIEAVVILFRILSSFRIPIAALRSSISVLIAC